MAVRAFLQDCVATGNHSALRQWALMRSASFLQPYFHIDNAEHGRRLLRQVLGRTGFELDTRRRPHKATKTQNFLQRLNDPAAQLCYSCAGMAVESTEHVLLHCPHVDLVLHRVAARAWLQEVARDPEAVGLARDAGTVVPDFTNDTDLWVVRRRVGQWDPCQSCCR